jgi:hypothetical protein
MMNSAAVELDAVRYYLRQWVRWRRFWRPGLGYPRSVPFVDVMRGSRPMDGYDDMDGDDARIHAETMRQLDQAIENDLGSDAKHALLVVYMREVGPAVWRSGRKSMQEIKALAWQAERDLVPILRRRNVLF